jgi:hypothetical protein
MRPPTPAMIEALRLYGGERLFYTGTGLHNRLLRHRLIRRDRNYQAIRWQLTPEGRRVLAEHTTGDE